MGEYEPMRVTLMCFGTLRDFLPDPKANSAVVEVVDGAQVSDVAASLGIPSRLLHAVLVDGEKALPSTSVQQGAEVTLMPPFSGGAISEEEPT